MNKSYILLWMYDDLRAGQAIKIDECCEMRKISVSTFRRYIACLRDYLMERHGEEIVYHPELSGYVLDKKREKP